jgi:Fe-S cluster assembly scaffold protein SufB
LYDAHPADTCVGFYVRKDFFMTTTDRPESQAESLESLGRYAFGWADSDEAGAAATRGLSEAKVREISALKNEPEWMLNFRLKGLRLFDKKPMPNWGADLSGIDFDNIKYFVRSSEKQAATWDDLPADIKNTYDKLGIPEAEKQRLIAGVAAQYECIHSDALVATDRGPVAVKEIEPGDLVISFDEDRGELVLARVSAAAQTGVKQTYRVRAGEREIRATDNHPFLCRTSEGLGWITVADLRPGVEVAAVDSATVSAVVSTALVGVGGGTGSVSAAHRPEWVVVDGIEPFGVEPVWDVEVEGSHNFVAEGLVVHNSEVVYHSIREDLEEKGVLFLDTDTALREHNDLFQEYFGSVIPAGDNKFAALNTAVWSGGSFIYVPKGVHVDIPLQAYFRINTENMGQFERTLIIADEDSYVHYVEGCLPAGELITTADGDLRPIETIRVGDHVLGHDGRSHRVTAVQMRDLNGELYTFTPMSPANAFSVTSEHPVLVAADGAEPSFVAAKDVSEGSSLVYPKPRIEWVNAVLPLAFARLAGAYLTAGTVLTSPGGPTVAITLPLSEAELVDDVRRAAKELYDAESLVQHDEAAGTTTITVEGPSAFAALIQNLGETERFISTELFAQDEVFVREFLRCVAGADETRCLATASSCIAC